MAPLKFKSAFCLLLVSFTLFASGCTNKAKAERHLKRGDDYYAKAEWEKAKLEYLIALRRGARDPGVLSRLGQCFLKGGEIGSAYQCLSEARTAQPTNILARLTVANLQVAFGEFKKAHEEAEAILKIEPNNSQGFTLLAQTATTPEEITAARKRLEQLQATAPGDSSLPFALGILAQKSSDSEAARAAFQKAIALDPKQSRFHLALAGLAAALGDTNTADSSFKSAIALAPLKSWDRLQYAEFLLKSKRFDDADKFLEQTIAQAPDFNRAIDTLSDSLIERGKLDDAEKYNVKALANSASDRDALINRARLKSLRGDAPGALAELNELSKTRPRDAEVQFNLAVAYLAGHDSVKALDALDSAVTFDPKLAKAVILRSELQLQKGDFNAAIPELTRIIRDVPDQANAYLLLATAYRQRKTYSDALPIYTALAKALPKNAQPFYFMGLTYREMNQPVEAREAFQKALQISPDHIGSVDELTMLDIAEHKLDSAMERLRPYLKEYAKTPTPYYIQAKVLIAAKKTDQAIQSLEKSLEIAPDFEVGRRALVQLYVSSGKTVEATRRLNEMLRKDPKDVAALNQLGMLQEGARDFKGARENYEAVIKIAPNSPIAFNNLALILADHFNDPERGLEYAKKARDLAPEDPSIADTYGWSLYHSGDYARALSPLQQAAEKFSDNPEVQYHLGMAEYMTGSDTEATAALKLAVQSNVESPWKENARHALAVLGINSEAAGPETVQLLRDTLQKQPADFTAQLRLAQIFDHQKNAEQAIQNYEAAVKINPRASGALARLADLYCFSLQKPQRALEFAKQAWSVSQDGEMAAIVGPVGFVAGDFKWASAVLTAARVARPQDAHIAFYLASAAYATGDFERAKEFFNESRASVASPEAVLAKQASSLIDFQSTGSDPTAASAAAAAALQTDKSFAPALITQGLLAESKGDYSTARAAYEQVLKAAPNHVAARRQLGLLLADKLSDDVKATQLLVATKADRPGDSQVTKALGKIAYRRSDYSEAARLLQDASFKLNDDSDLLYHLGMAQFHLNNNAAKDVLTRALKMDSNATMAADARKAIGQLK